MGFASVTDFPARNPDALARRIGFLARESIEEWTLRFHRERGLPEPTPAQLAKIIELGRQDEATPHTSHQ